MAVRMTPEARREQILQVAHQVFLDEGFRKVSLRGVAARCGMSAPGLMHYFPDLESLLTAVLERREAREIEALTVAPGTEDSPEASMRAMLRTAVAHYRARDAEVGRFRILEGEAVDPSHPAHRYFASRFARNRRSLESTMDAWMENAEEMSHLVNAAFEGLRLQWDWDPDGFDIEAELDRVMPALLAGARPRG